ALCERRRTGKGEKIETPAIEEVGRYGRAVCDRAAYNRGYARILSGCRRMRVGGGAQGSAKGRQHGLLHVLSGMARPETAVRFLQRSTPRPRRLMTPPMPERLTSFELKWLTIRQDCR